MSSWSSMEKRGQWVLSGPWTSPTPLILPTGFDTPALSVHIYNEQLRALQLVGSFLFNLKSKGHVLILWVDCYLKSFLWKRTMNGFLLVNILLGKELTDIRNLSRNIFATCWMNNNHTFLFLCKCFLTKEKKNHQKFFAHFSMIQLSRKKTYSKCLL